MRSGVRGLVFCTVMSLPWMLQAQVEVAASQGEVLTLRAGKWSRAEIGEQLKVGERVKTESAERVKLLFLDSAVLNLAPNSEIVIDEAESRSEGRRAIALRLLRGRLLATVGSEFQGPGSYVNVETGTAVATSRGGEVLVQYDAQDEATEVLSLEGEAEVVSNMAALAGGKVRVPAGAMVRIRKGRLPGAAVTLGPERARQLAEGVELFGTGRRDGLNVLHPLLAGKLLSPEHVPGGRAASRAAGSELGLTPPGPTLGAAYSADVYTNTQPIEVFRALPPGRPLGGDVRVDF